MRVHVVVVAMIMMMISSAKRVIGTWDVDLLDW